jgi:hypothetical protein
MAANIKSIMPAEAAVYGTSGGRSHSGEALAAQSSELPPKDRHIAARKAQFEEEIWHFSNTAQIATVESEKLDAQARVEIAQHLLKALQSL